MWALRSTEVPTDGDEVVLTVFEGEAFTLACLAIVAWAFLNNRESVSMPGTST
jgi:hypothetical protein